VTVVVPEITPAAKIAATRGYGAEVVVEGDIYERSYEYARERAAETGETFVHPFDNRAVIAGQGTVGLELLDQYPELDAVLVAIGGGGLISGIGTAAKAHDPTIRVVGVQPEGAFHAKPSLDDGVIHELDDVDNGRRRDSRHANARDDVLGRSRGGRRRRARHRPGDSHGRHVAVRTCEDRCRERGRRTARGPPSNGTDFADEDVGVVVSGGNVNLTEHAELCRTGLHELGRYADVRLALDTWPATLADVIGVVESQGPNSTT